MKYIPLITFTPLFLLSCSNKSEKNTAQDSSAQDKSATGSTAYKEAESVTFQLLQKDSTQGWQYRTNETNYKVV